MYVYHMVELARDRTPPLSRLSAKAASAAIAEIIGHPAESVRDWYKMSKKTIGDDPITADHLALLRRIRDDKGPKASIIEVLVEFDKIARRGMMLEAG
jgi:hypothetical protein